MRPTEASRNLALVTIGATLACVAAIPFDRAAGQHVTDRKATVVLIAAPYPVSQPEREPVPATVLRALLEDPAIRSVSVLAENAWDFTAPDGVPGFGSMP